MGIRVIPRPLINLLLVVGKDQHSPLPPRPEPPRAPGDVGCWDPEPPASDGLPECGKEFVALFFLTSSCLISIF